MTAFDLIAILSVSGLAIFISSIMAVYFMKQSQSDH
ncbi:hypothetical protein SAMN05518683_114105 [Salibacterium halotolerans]|uniref:Uncharacterized protein n=1 Tax=Salibacterium halotolerans TaxID=1884432 RepID=A0A1I5V024_9BACI|nr:hypothetical protein SAMN05518683_114105 [Salibacterium halotolerans]